MGKELLFCGAHRENARRKIKRSFDDVAAAADALRNGKAKNSTRVILIEGERGVGKTRLAMELYRYLSTSHDPEHYWPDDYERIAERVGIMPRAETCNYHGSPQFLWWGMGIAEGPNPGNTIFQSLEDLFPHLTSARIAARRRETGRGVAAELAELGSEFGIPLAEAALDVAGIGMIKSLGMAAWKIGGLIRQQHNAPDIPLDEGRRQVDTVVDNVMSDLTRLLSPRSRDFAGLPMVMVVDDAQFDGDPAMADFVERLIRRSVSENWPLLLIMTHWSRQMGQWVDGQGQRHLASRIARVLQHAQNGKPFEPGPFAKVGGGSLSEGNFTRIALGLSQDDLSPAVRDRFPGLEESDVDQIALKSGGNPRKLEQVLARMDRKPIWFEGGDKCRWLTERGRMAVMELADLDIDEVVLERFSDTSPEVRRAMMLASLVGNRFVVDIVDRLSQAKLANLARDPLEEGETSYRFLRDVTDRSRNDIGSFTERLFIEAAREYRESGMARESFPDWPEDAELFTALDSLLRQLVDDPKTFDGLGDDDVAECLSLSATRMVTADDPLAGLALARLVHLENQRGNAEGAYEAAQRFIDGFEG